MIILYALQYLDQIGQILMAGSKMKIINIIISVISIILLICSFINVYDILFYDDSCQKQVRIQIKLQKQSSAAITEILIQDEPSVIDNNTKQSQIVGKIEENQTIEEQIISYNQERLNKKAQARFYQQNLKPIPELDFEHLTQQEIQQYIQDRINMGSPSQQMRKLKVWVIQGSSRSYHCALMNSINILTPTSILTIKRLISNLKIGNVVIFTDRLDQFADQLMQQNFNQNQITFYNVAIDSDYKFIDYVFKSRHCHKIMYLSHNFDLVQSKMVQVKMLMNQSSQTSVYYSSSGIINKQIKQLNNLQQIDLSTIEAAQLNKHIYIFDQMYLGLITPVNFGYYAKYTIQEIIIYPILAISQKYGNLKPFKQVIHQFNSSYVSYKYFSLVPPQQQPKSLCFISYPSNPANQSIEQLLSYLSNFQTVDQKVAIIIFLPYKFTQFKNNGTLFVKILKVFQKNKLLRIRLVIKGQKAISSLSIYQGVYNFCRGSVIVSTRHNTKLKPQFFNIVSQSISQKYHYYWINYIKNGKQVVLPKQKLQSNKISIDFYSKYFQSIQIFKGDLLKSGLFWNLLSRQLIFYQSEFSFVKPLLQLTNYNIFIINKTLATICKRNFTQNQQEQNKIIHQISRLEQKQLSYVLQNGHEQQKNSSNLLSPILYNQLENEAFHKNAPEIIPLIIHKISWKQNNNEEKQWEDKLNKKLNSIHQPYKIMNWKQEEITQKQFPLTYPLFVRYSQLNGKNSQKIRQIFIMLIKYEAIFNYGGVYLDLFVNVQHIQSLRSFFKFQIFFLPYESDILKIRSSAFSFRIMGATQHNQHLKLTLCELISQQKIDKMIDSKDYIEQLDIIKQSFNEQQLFVKVGFGLNFLNPSIKKSVIQKLLQKEKNEV